MEYPRISKVKPEEFDERRKIQILQVFLADYFLSEQYAKRQSSHYTILRE